MYIPTKLHLSHEEVHHLLHGHGIRVHRGHLHPHGHIVHLTAKQHKAIHSSRGHGHLLKFSASQAKRNIKHGGSIFSDIWNTIKHGAKTIYRHGKSAAKSVYPYAKKAAKTAYAVGAPIVQAAIDKEIEKQIENPAIQAVAKSAVRGTRGAIERVANHIDTQYTNPASVVKRASHHVVSTGKSLRERVGRGRSRHHSRHSRRSKRGGSRARAPQLYNNDVYNTGANRQIGIGRAPQLYNDDVYNTGANRQIGTGTRRHRTRKSTKGCGRRKTRKGTKRGSGRWSNLGNSLGSTISKTMLGLGRRRKRTKKSRGGSYRAIGGSFIPI